MGRTFDMGVTFGVGEACRSEEAFDVGRTSEVEVYRYK